MVNAIPGIQINTIDLSTHPQNNIIAQTGGVGLSCPNGVMMQDIALAAASSNVPVQFPIGVTSAVFIFIAAITATDLIVKVGSGTPVSLSLPQYQGMMLYGISSSAITFSSVKGGTVQYAIGG